MAEPSGKISIQPDLVADTQSLAKELDISWSQLITLALKDFIRRHRGRQGLVDQINAAYTDGPDDEETQLLQTMRPTHRRIVEGEW
jgi:hypothetical protein